MSVAGMLVILWVLLAALLAVSPARRWAGVAVWVLLAFGIPLLGLVTWEHGPVAGSLLFVLGILLLSWPRMPVSRRVQRWLWRAQ
ncbi:DUF2484 family protein [Halodurantibacterium flavum]|uniref:DUF2484 family protein n=1 Tax=Halodurantibacterium flavum TaxID=1382802 RepID=A0ABW4SB86_9RHOB